MLVSKQNMQTTWKHVTKLKLKATNMMEEWP